VLQGIIFLIDLVENLPSHIKLNLLPHDLHLILVLCLVKLNIIFVKLLVHPVLCFFHHVVEHLVVLVADLLVPLKNLLGSLVLARAGVGHV